MADVTKVFQNVEYKLAIIIGTVTRPQAGPLTTPCVRLASLIIHRLGRLVCGRATSSIRAECTE